MRVLISDSPTFWVSYKAIVRARELGALWAMVEHTPLIDEPEHHGYQDPEVMYADGDRYDLPNGVPRHDPVLLQVFDELGWEEMAGVDKDPIHCVLVPDDVTYTIASYTREWVEEQHRCWGPAQGEWLAGNPSYTKDSKFVPKTP